MKPYIPSTSIRIIYWGVQIAFWIFNVTIAGVLVLSLYMAFAFAGTDDFQLHVGLPIQADVLEQAELCIDDDVVKVQLKEMSGKIHFIDTPPEIARVYAVFSIVISALFFYAFWVFRKFITNVYRGKFFDRSNIALLKRISYLVLIFWGFIIFYSLFQYWYLVQNMNFSTVDFRYSVRFYGEILALALFIWVLSHIFMKGCELQEDHNLTI